MKKQKRTFKQNRIFTQNNPLSPRICPELAKEIGLSESILLLQYEFWIATEGEERQGQLWIRKTIREIKQVFSFWGTSTINRLINSLVADGYMIADAFDEGERKNGRWLRFGFEKLATLSSIKIICAETGQTICADLDDISPEMAQDVTQNGTNNGSAPYREERDQEKKDKGDSLSEYKTNPTYARLDVDLEFGKAETWAAKNHRQVTPRFFVNWLNRALENVPLNGNSNGHDDAWHEKQARLAAKLGRTYERPVTT